MIILSDLSLVLKYNITEALAEYVIRPLQILCNPNHTLPAALCMTDKLVCELLQENTCSIVFLLTSFLSVNIVLLGKKWALI